MNPETKLQNEIMVKMSELGCIPMRRNVGLFYTQNMIPIHIGTEGEPDIEIICPNGKVLWYEIKTKKGVTRDKQDRFHNELRKLGHLVFVVRSAEQAVHIYNTYVGQTT
ncbi:VRR-NUC domain-containing protein [Thomasclavelia cocleata]|uniref:VRR-NUC domain-containing protein n=1 Tax=Thomasclavelia cocleata TaxID=69824 RepID=UPI00272D9758|nr:VRR-NUC domain-containing protein [Thomasclavelia cocleata]